MLLCSLFKREPQARIHERHVKAGLQGLFNGAVIDSLHGK